MTRLLIEVTRLASSPSYTPGISDAPSPPQRPYFSPTLYGGQAILYATVISTIILVAICLTIRILYFRVRGSGHRNSGNSTFAIVGSSEIMRNNSSGLPRVLIESFPKFVYDPKAASSEASDSCCNICLEEYSSTARLHEEQGMVKGPNKVESVMQEQAVGGMKQQQEVGLCKEMIHDGEEDDKQKLGETEDGGEEVLLRRLPECNHYFHAGCIDMWLSSHTSCPTCRTSLLPKGMEIPESGASMQADWGDWRPEMSVSVGPVEPVYGAYGTHQMLVFTSGGHPVSNREAQLLGSSRVAPPATLGALPETDGSNIIRDTRTQVTGESYSIGGGLRPMADRKEETKESDDKRGSFIVPNAEAEAGGSSRAMEPK